MQLALGAAPCLRCTLLHAAPALSPAAQLVSHLSPHRHMQVIVPAIGSGSGAGLSDWRGWLGFGLSLASMATTVVYFVSLQASRRLGFTSLQLQVGRLRQLQGGAGRLPDLLCCAVL